MNQKRLFIVASFLTIGAISTFLFFYETPTPVQFPQPTQPPKPTQHAPKPKQSPAVTQTTQEPVSEPSATSAIKLRFKPETGQTLAFAFESESDAQIDFSFITPNIATSGNPSTSMPSQGQKTPVVMQARGELYLKYFSLEPERWQVAAQLSGVSYQLNQQTPSYTMAITYPFTFQMTTTGFLSHFQFTQNMPTEARQFIKQLLYTMQIAYPKEPKIEWRTKEIDVTGRYQATYQLNKLDKNADLVTIVKQKLNYLSTPVSKYDINPALSQSETRFVKNLTTVTTSLADAWLLSLTHTEQVNSFSGAYSWAETHTKNDVRRITKDLTKVFPETLEQFLVQLEAAKFTKAQYYNTDPYFDKLGMELDLNEALGLFAQLRNADILNAQRTAEKFFVNYLRQFPQAAFTVVDLLDSDPKRERFDQSTQLILWRLLTEAGHAEAQQAVVNTLTDPNRSRLTKMRALAYLHDFEYPEAATVDTLWQFTSTLDPQQSQQNREIRTMGLYALGSLGNQEKRNDAVKPEISTILANNLENTTDPEEQAVTLGALGNYGGTEVLDIVEPFFTAENEKVRVSAYEALRHVETPQAVAMLTTHYEAETSLAVRTAALKSLSEMTPTVEGVEWANKTVLNVETPQEQVPLVEVLGKTLDTYPDNEQTLRTLLQKDLNNKVKKDIYRYVVPTH